MLCSISSVLFVFITLSLQNQVLTSPVLLWSNLNLPKSSVSLGTLSPLDLISNSICKLSNEQIQLHIVAVDDLSIEDIRHSLHQKNPLLLEVKKEQTNFRYYPNVDDDVYRTFTLLPQSNNMKCSHIHFQLASSRTVKTLHDATHQIQETIDKTGTNTNEAVIIALISHSTEEGQLSRQRREVQSTAKSNVILSNDQNCMFYAKYLTWIDGSGTGVSKRDYDLDFSRTTCVPNTNISSSNQSSVILNLVWVNRNTSSDTITMKLNATIIGRYWYLTNVTVNDNEYRYFAYGMHSLMDTPPKYSYACTTATFTRYDNAGKYGAYNVSNKFFIKHFQFQPFHANGSQFGPPNYCTSFFTSGIWMGITSSLLCLGILLFGIYRMMTIKSNDRFDDPKGKPLVIKAQE